MTRFERYVALGDSQTEGLNDGDERSGYRGWADRLAERLAAGHPEFAYANLAVRGLRTREIRDTQLEPALAMRPDLATVMAGMNDLLRPRFDAAQVADGLEDMFAALSAAGARVVTVTFPDIAEIMPMTRPLAPRVRALNAALLVAAERHGVVVVRCDRYPICTDPRIWSEDRLHANALGHTLIADAMAHALGLPDADDAWTRSLTPLPRSSRWSTARTEGRWLRTFVGPWLGRRIRGTSSSAGRTAKRPDLLPFA